MTTSDTARPDTARARSRSPLRKLSDDQEREVARLYSATETGVPEIARRFEIGESSVYRIAQRYGASTRTAAAGGKQDKAPSGRRAGQTGKSRGGRQPAQRPSGQARPAASSSGARRYRIAYTASVVVEADSVKRAVERAEAQGAIEIISVEPAG